ncbi:MAG: TerC family protein [Beijerinckiaceae bacterium]
MDWLLDPNIWAAFLTLAILEIVLGIDNLIFISISADRLPKHQQAFARRLGLFLALFMRLGLLASIAWIVSLRQPVFSILGNEISWRDMILIGGGVFLLYKGVSEIHALIEGEEEHGTPGRAIRATMASVLSSIVMLDIVFSLDSVITAVGMSDDFWVMAAAIIAAVIVMLFANAPVSRFINEHPTVKMLALAFLLLIGVVLVADGFGHHVPKGFVYSAIGFAILVEMLNLAVRRKAARREPRIKTPVLPDEANEG